MCVCVYAYIFKVRRYVNKISHTNLENVAAMKAIYYSEHVISDRQAQTPVYQKLLLSNTLDLSSSACSFTVR